jgi:hypothetical protein
MRLYQHSARCPVALCSFLQCNPSYWCFIPMLWEDAPYHDLDSPRNMTSTDREVLDAMESSINNDQTVSYLYNRVPLPPAAYVFSYRQRRRQRLFFEDYLACENHRLPYIAIDLYKVDIVAVCKCTYVS